MAKKCVVLLLLSMILSVTPAYASLSIGGSSGLLNIPTTDLQPRGSFTLNYYNVGFRGSRFNVTYGITHTLEMGINLTIDDRRQQVGPHIKGVFLLDEDQDMSLGVGLINLDLYALIGSNLGVEGFDGFFGFGTGDLGGFFGGFSRSIEPMSFMEGSYRIPSRFVIDYAKERLCLGFQMRLSNEFGATLGYQDLLGKENSVILGLEFTTSF